MAIHMFVVYPLFVMLLGGKNPFAFFAQVRDPMLVAFSTASSNATLPVSLRAAETELKLPRKISRFVLTVGATANQNGTALFEGVTVLFLAQFFGIPLTLDQQVLVMLVCILGGIGTAGVPAGSLPVIAMILAMVGVPPEGIGLILGVDRFLDMCRTTLNVTGDLVVAQVVSRGEKDPSARWPSRSRQRRQLVRRVAAASSASGDEPRARRALTCVRLARVDAFVHVVGLLGARVRHRSGAPARARQRTGSGAPAREASRDWRALAAFNAVLLVYANWLALWAVRNLARLDAAAGHAAVPLRAERLLRLRAGPAQGVRRMNELEADLGRRSIWRGIACSDRGLARAATFVDRSRCNLSLSAWDEPRRTCGADNATNLLSAAVVDVWPSRAPPCAGRRWSGWALATDRRRHRAICWRSTRN